MLLSIAVISKLDLDYLYCSLIISGVYERSSNISLYDISNVVFGVFFTFFSYQNRKMRRIRSKL